MILSVTHAMLDAEEYMYHVGGKNQAFFTTSNPVYLFTNDKPLDILNNLDLGGSLLSVTASFDRQLNAILLGCEDIRAFDVNRSTKCFAELKIEAIKQLSEDEKRFYQRNRIRKWNYVLNKTASKQELKILIDFIMMDIKVYIMVRLQMI